MHGVLHSEDKTKELNELKTELLETLGKTVALNCLRLGIKTTAYHSKYLLSKRKMELTGTGEGGAPRDRFARAGVISPSSYRTFFDPALKFLRYTFWA